MEAALEGSPPASAWAAPCSSPTEFLTFNAVAAAARACMRPLLVLRAASAMLSAVCMALMTGLPMLTLKPLCLKRCSVAELPVSRASTI
jgi:hypothetical protein